VDLPAPARRHDHARLIPRRRGARGPPPLHRARPLDAVIGLPAGLFYGTGIPACILVMNKPAAAARRDVLFLNADREYREGKAQNFIRPEDIAKIVHVYCARQTVPGYARLSPSRKSPPRILTATSAAPRPSPTTSAPTFTAASPPPRSRPLPATGKPTPA
jgi:hypothetical protein